VNKKKLVDLLFVLGIIFIVFGLWLNLRQKEEVKVEIVKRVIPTGVVNGSLINLNTASIDELDSLPGIGPVTAQKIIDYRLLNGNFKSIEEIKNISGIGEKKYGAIKAKIGI